MGEWFCQQADGDGISDWPRDPQLDSSHCGIGFQRTIHHGFSHERKGIFSGKPVLKSKCALMNEQTHAVVGLAPD